MAQGYTQRKVIDYTEVFSLVVKHTSIRVLMFIVAQFDWELEQLNVKTAILHGDLEEKILMTRPEGFKELEKEHLMCLLKKSLYGLKQSLRQWYKRFDNFILKIHFKRSNYDGCFYYKKL